jgi:two-component system phosphate regulon sensor histidine kinase PhoR
MVLRSRTIRLGIFISTFVIAAIIIFQLIWLKRVYRYEQKQFDQGIAKAIRGFYEDMNQSEGQSPDLDRLITHANDQTFTARIKRTDINKDSLGFYLQSELEDEDILTDCYIGLYDAQKKAYVYTLYLHSATASKNADISLPLSRTSYHHLTLFFPHREQYIMSQMNIWIISSIVLLIVLILFGGSLYYFYRQKFLNEIQKDFVNNFTHEFKTPVAVINLAADVLNNPSIVHKPEKLSQYASIVQYQGKYLQEQIERLLRHAYAETKSLYLKKERVDLHELIDEALNNLQPLVQSKSAKVECDFEAGDAFLMADRGYLLIVIINIIENALKYSVQPVIRISTTYQNGLFVVSVKDNGKGIGKKYLDKVFRTFYRVPNGEEVHTRGFGLGLAFVKKIIVAHRGKIRLESIPGVGSDFRLSLPQS